MSQIPTSNPYGAPISDPHSTANSEVSALAMEMLRRTKGWVLFLSIIGYISCGLMVVAALFMMLGMSVMSSQVDTGLPMGFAGLGLIYLILAALYIYPCVKLTQYSSSIKRLLASQSTIDLETALDHQRGFWKFCGIMALIMVSLYALIFVVAIIAGIAGVAMES